MLPFSSKAVLVKSVYKCHIQLYKTYINHLKKVIYNISDSQERNKVEFQHENYTLTKRSDWFRDKERRWKQITRSGDLCVF